MSDSGRLYNIVERKNPAGRDPLVEAVREEDEELAKEAKRLRLQEIIEERKRKIAKLKGGEEAEAGNPTPKIQGLTLEEAKELAKIEDPQQREWIKNALISSRLTTPTRGVDPTLWMLLGFMRSNPGAGQSELTQFANSITNAVKTGMEASKGGGGQSSPLEGASKFLESISDLIAQGIRDPIISAIEKVKPQPSVFETILMDDRLFEKAQKLGMFGGQPQIQPEAYLQGKKLDLEIERERTERALLLQDRQFMREQEERRTQAQERQTESLARVGQTVIPAVLAALGGETPEKSSPQPEYVPQPCRNCGTQIPIPLKDRPSKVKCPSCGLEHNVEWKPVEQGSPKPG